MNARRVCGLIPPCLLFLACAQGESTNGGPAVRDSAGVEIVENGRAGAWGPALATVEEVVRIGVAEGADHLQFYRILSLDVAADGTIYAGNDQTGTVRAFTADGTFLREFGGKGRGPGEYIMVNRVWMAGDSVVITDWQSGGRNGVYSRDGQLVAFWPSAQIGGGRVSPMALTPYGWVASYSPPYRPPAVAPGEKWAQRGALVRFDPGSATMGDTLFLTPPRVLYGSPETEGMDWALFDPPVPFDFDAAGRIYLSHGEPYRIEVHEPILDPAARNEAGAFRLARIITRAIDAVPIMETDIERLKERVSEFYDTMTTRDPESRSAERERVIRRIDNQRGFNPRPHLPPLRRLLVSHDGSFWIERADIASPADLEFERLFGGFGRGQPRATRWDLYDGEGRFLAQVDLHPRFTPHAVRGPEITGVLKDELDIEFVVTYRVISPS